MSHSDAAGMTVTSKGGAGILVWIFRILLIAGAALMIYSWLQPWWSADIAVIKGDNDMVLHPWGADVAGTVRANIDESAFEMPFPAVFAGFMWVYLGVCMVALAVSLFWNKRLRIGKFSLPWAMVFILLVGLSYAAAAGLAFGIGTLKAGASGANFIGKSNVLEPGSGAKLKMVSQLEIGYWLALGAGGFLTLLGLVRPLFVRKPKA